MKKRKYIGKSALLPASLLLMLVSLWEICIRMDAMYKPLKMFFSMAVGEGIGPAAAMSYFDYAIFEAPIWLAGCILISVLSLALSSRPKGGLILLPVSLAMALYGLTREASFLTDIWRLIQPALLLIISALSTLNLFLHPIRRAKNKPLTDAPRMTDAPRLKNIRSSSERRTG